MIKTILLRSTIATLVAWAGGATGALIGGAARLRLLALVTAALGALLAVTIFDILPDAKQLLPVPSFLFATASGALLFWIIGRYIYPVCPACSFAGTSAVPEPDLSRVVVLLMIALGLHSTMDGAAVVIGDTLAHGANAGVFFAVSLHKFPEGIALVLLLIGAGMRRRNALLLTIAIEAATELGALGALLLVNRLPPYDLGLIFANIGGGFLYLVVTTLGSERHKAEEEGGASERKLTMLTGAAGFAATCVIMLVSSQLSH
jgi:zinc transporter ZupT